MIKRFRTLVCSSARFIWAFLVAQEELMAHDRFWHITTDRVLTADGRFRGKADKYKRPALTISFENDLVARFSQVEGIRALRNLPTVAC
jgi:hypothetical protein